MPSAGLGEPRVGSTKPSNGMSLPFAGESLPTSGNAERIVAFALPLLDRVKPWIGPQEPSRRPVNRAGARPRPLGPVRRIFDSRTQPGGASRRQEVGSAISALAATRELTMSKTPQRKSATSIASKRRTYFPSKSFDDDLVALVDLFMKSRWVFSGVDLAQLREDAHLQRAERLAHDAAEAAWLKARKEFGVQTEARHQRYSAALATVRGAYRHDPGVTAQLAKFRRPRTRRSSKVVNVPILGSTKN